MTYYTKIHFIENSEYFENNYDGRSILALSYNEALSLIGEEEEVF